MVRPQQGVFFSDRYLDGLDCIQLHSGAFVSRSAFEKMSGSCTAKVRTYLHDCFAMHAHVCMYVLSLTRGAGHTSALGRVPLAAIANMGGLSCYLVNCM